MQGDNASIFYHTFLSGKHKWKADRINPPSIYLTYYSAAVTTTSAPASILDWELALPTAALPGTEAALKL